MWVGVPRQRVGFYFGFGRSSGASARPRVLLVSLPLAVLAAVLVVLFRAGHSLLAVLVFALGWPLLAIGNRLARRSTPSRAEGAAKTPSSGPSV